MAVKGAGRVRNGFPPVPESVISRTVSGWELWIGGRIMCSPGGLEVGVWSPHAVLYLFSWLQCTNSTERKQPFRLCFHTHIKASKSLFLVVSCPLFQSSDNDLSFPSEIISSCWMSLALDKPLCCIERADSGLCKCGITAALVHRPTCSLFWTIITASQLFSLPLI